MANIAAIVGRPNVGKSTFFNRLAGSREAIMDNESGVTRDRHYAQAEWGGKYFTVIDTGGYVEHSDDIFEKEIKKQVELAIHEATVILFMVDVKAGLTGLDSDFAKMLRSVGKPVYIVANKADTFDKISWAYEFYALGFDNIYPVSSQTGSGTGDLLDEIVQHFNFPGEENPYAGIPRIAVLGKPNVGKSSLLNVLLDDERSIVTNQAGTTRDAIDSYYSAYGMEFIITDTAGIRKKTSNKENIEFYSIMRAIRTLEASDVCIILIDAVQGISAQDINIINLAHKNRKGIVLLVNKWDLIEKDTYTAKNFENEIKRHIAPNDYFPVIFTSVIRKQRVYKTLQEAGAIYERMKKRISGARLNERMLKAIEKYPPPAYRGKYIRIKYVAQLPTDTPTFAFYCNEPEQIKTAYKRYLENKLREYFDFKGVPIALAFRKK